jgi:hypothetical protein
MTENSTPWLQFAGTNERGNPPMRKEAVKADMEHLMKHFDSLVVQEFRWDYYWDALGELFNKPGNRWASYPGVKRGKRTPVSSGQPNLWNGAIFTREKSKVTLSHLGRAGISESRWFRASLLSHKASLLKHWEVGGHFVVGGDQDGDGPKRKKMLRKNIRRFVRFLRKLKKTGHAIIGQLDANIRKGGWAYRLWISEMMKVGARFHGELGIEYLFTIPGTDGTEIKVRNTFRILPKRHGGPLFTDHETRGIEYMLVKKG